MASCIMGNEFLPKISPGPNIKGDLQDYETIEIINSYIKRTSIQRKITSQAQNLFGILRKTRRSVEQNLEEIEKKDMLELKKMIKSMMRTSSEMIDLLNNQPAREIAQNLKMSPVDDGYEDKINSCTNVNKTEFVDHVSNFTCKVKTEKVEIKTERMDEKEVEQQMEQEKVKEQIEEETVEEQVEELMEDEKFDDRMDEENSDDEERTTCFQNESNTSFEDMINKKLSYMAPENKLKVPSGIMGNHDRYFTLDQRVECIRLINSENSNMYQHFYHYYYNFYMNSYQNYYENHQTMNYQPTYDPRFYDPQRQSYPEYYCNTMY